MRPAEQVWSDPDVASLFLYSLEVFRVSVHPTFYSMLL